MKLLTCANCGKKFKKHGHFRVNCSHKCAAAYEPKRKALSCKKWREDHPDRARKAKLSWESRNPQKVEAHKCRWRQKAQKAIALVEALGIQL